VEQVPGLLLAWFTPDIKMLTKSTILNAFLILLALATPLLAQDRPATDVQRDVLDQFLVRFDRISAQGFVKTRRTGDTGVGYTLESLLELKENNSPRGDFLGMEVKAYRDSEEEFDDHEKMNLFLKEPQWIDGLKSAERVRQYGYRDPNGRQAWYLSVTCKVNDAGLQLQVNEQCDSLTLLRHDQPIGNWSVETLQQRLTEKHAHSVFVAAETRGEGKDEEFRYRTVTWCRDASAARLLELVNSGDVIVELRIHLRADGSVRNHGTAFRVRKHQLEHLFAMQERVRPKADAR